MVGRLRFVSPLAGFVPVFLDTLEKSATFKRVSFHFHQVNNYCANQLAALRNGPHAGRHRYVVMTLEGAVCVTQ